MKKWKKTHRQRKRARSVIEKIKISKTAYIALCLLARQHHLSKKKMLIKCIKNLIDNNK